MWIANRPFIIKMERSVHLTWPVVIVLLTTLNTGHLSAVVKKRNFGPPYYFSTKRKRSMRPRNKCETRTWINIWHLVSTAKRLVPASGGWDLVVSRAAAMWMELKLQTGSCVNGGDHRLTSVRRPEWTGVTCRLFFFLFFFLADSAIGDTCVSPIILQHNVWTHTVRSKQIMRILTITSQREW